MSPFSDPLRYLNSLWITCKRNTFCCRHCGLTPAHAAILTWWLEEHIWRQSNHDFSHFLPNLFLSLFLSFFLLPSYFFFPYFFFLSLPFGFAKETLASIYYYYYYYITFPACFFLSPDFLVFLIFFLLYFSFTLSLVINFFPLKAFSSFYFFLIFFFCYFSQNFSATTDFSIVVYSFIYLSIVPSTFIFLHIFLSFLSLFLLCLCRCPFILHLPHNLVRCCFFTTIWTVPQFN